jgi:hypothetical protein
VLFYHLIYILKRPKFIGKLARDVTENCRTLKLRDYGLEEH